MAFVFVADFEKPRLSGRLDANDRQSGFGLVQEGRHLAFDVDAPAAAAQARQAAAEKVEDLARAMDLREHVAAFSAEADGLEAFERGLLGGGVPDLIREKVVGVGDGKVAEGFIAPGHKLDDSVFGIQFGRDGFWVPSTTRRKRGVAAFKEKRSSEILDLNSIIFSSIGNSFFMKAGMEARGMRTGAS